MVPKKRARVIFKVQDCFVLRVEELGDKERVVTPICLADVGESMSNKMVCKGSSFGIKCEMLGLRARLL
jgi:hypothetical protein